MAAQIGRTPPARAKLFDLRAAIGIEMEAGMQDKTVTQEDTAELDRMQSAYKAAVEEWIAAIRQEEALASVNHTIAEVDQWEGAHFKEDEIRSKVKAAKKQYEDALRKQFFRF
jgi:hypothetical protein